jgi:hypothetical protein
MRPERLSKIADGRFPAACVVMLICVALLSTAKQATANEHVDAEAQERVATLIQSVLGGYPAGSRWTNSAISSSSTAATNIEINLREASRLMPNRLDLRFGIASALISQALQTNFPFEAKMKAALRVYEEIHELDTNGFQARLLHAAYSRAIGDTNGSELTLLALSKAHPQRTQAYREKFRRLDQSREMALSTNVPVTMPKGTNHVLIILGAGLETNGIPKPKLLDRLKQGKLVANEYPNAPVIVTGGNQKAGITEAYVMSRWLIAEGLSTNRIILEDNAKDTVGNAVRCSYILKALGATHVTLITSSTHLKRALLDFHEAALQEGLTLEFAHVVAIDKNDTDEPRERVGVYRDLLRASGIWTYPGIAR